MGATWFEKLIEPQYFEVAANANAIAFVLSMLGALAGVAGMYFLIKRFGQPGSGLSHSESVFAFPLALTAFILPPVLAAMVAQQDITKNPLPAALFQIAIAFGCMLFLAHHRWRPAEEKRGVWFQVKPKQLVFIPLLWLLAMPVMQLGMFASIQLHEWLDIAIEKQAVVERLRESTSTGDMITWYLLAVVAAPLVEEFVFRVAIFGGIRKLLDGISEQKGWRHPGALIAMVVSIAVFVLAHGVWGWTVGIIPLTLLSVILTLVYAHTRSVWASIIYHASHNCFVVTMQFFVLV